MIPVYHLKQCPKGNSSQTGIVPILTRNSPQMGTISAAGNISLNRQEPSVPPLTPPVEGNGQLNENDGFCLEATPPRVKKPKRKSKTVPKEPSEEFRTFFNAYPRGEDMKRAWAAWYRSEETRPLLSDILEAVRRAKKTDGWRRGFIPLAASWINAERWDDDLKIR